MQHKNWNIHLRELTPNYPTFPIDRSTTTLIIIYPKAKEVRQYKAAETKLWALQRVGMSDIVIVCWPGRYSQDAFLVTDPSWLALWLENQGFEPKTPRWVG